MIVIVGVLGDLRIRIKNGNGRFVFLDLCCECTFGLSVVCPITVFTVYFVYNISFFVVFKMVCWSWELSPYCVKCLQAVGTPSCRKTLVIFSDTPLMYGMVTQLLMELFDWWFSSWLSYLGFNDLRFQQSLRKADR